MTTPVYDNIFDATDAEPIQYAATITCALCGEAHTGYAAYEHEARRTVTRTAYDGGWWCSDDGEVQCPDCRDTV